MVSETNKTRCEKCNREVLSQPTLIEYCGQQTYLFDPILCEPCLLRLCGEHAVSCANCGGSIPPYSQVGVLKAEDGKKQFIHMTSNCNSAGSAFHGYLGKGELGNFVQIEAC